MSEEARLMLEQRSNVVATTHEVQATRVRLVLAEARAQRRVARRLRDRALAGRERHLDVSWRL